MEYKVQISVGYRLKNQFDTQDQPNKLKGLIKVWLGFQFNDKLYENPSNENILTLVSPTLKWKKKLVFS